MKLIELPNIGQVLAAKLKRIQVQDLQQLKDMGAENALMKIAIVDSNDVCINMLYAIEGAIQGIRWHGLSKERKQELLAFYQMFSSQMGLK